MEELSFTGERLVPGVQGNIAYEHLHRYAFAFEHVKGKKVLDIACGEGYGSCLLSDIADLVVGVDISEEAINHASRKYVKPNLNFKVGLAEKIPFPDEFFDVVVSYETIEHLILQNEMVNEIHRVLNKNGILIISSPDKDVYSDSRNYKNEFHEKELYAEEFVHLVKMYFSHVSIFGQASRSCSLIFPLDKNASQIDFWEGNYRKLDNSRLIPHKFILIIASKNEYSSKKYLSFFSGHDDQRVIYCSDFELYKKSLRYKLSNIIFFPWDLFKNIKKVFKR